MGLHRRMADLSVAYQGERGEFEDADTTRVLFRVLLELAENTTEGKSVQIVPKAVADRMNEIAEEEDLAPAEAGKTFTDSRRVGWMLKRHRFKKGPRERRSKVWEVTRKEIVSCARAYGVVLQEDRPGGGAPAPKAEIF